MVEERGWGDLCRHHSILTCCVFSVQIHFCPSPFWDRGVRWNVADVMIAKLHRQQNMNASELYINLTLIFWKMQDSELLKHPWSCDRLNCSFLFNPILVKMSSSMIKPHEVKIWIFCCHHRIIHSIKAYLCITFPSNTILSSDSDKADLDSLALNIAPECYHKIYDPTGLEFGVRLL